MAEIQPHPGHGDAARAFCTRRPGTRSTSSRAPVRRKTLTARTVVGQPDPVAIRSAPDRRSDGALHLEIRLGYGMVVV